MWVKKDEKLNEKVCKGLVRRMPRFLGIALRFVGVSLHLWSTPL